jgi:hypothetical protein
MPDSHEPVFYLLPDGTKVSNDPRFVAEESSEEIDLNSPSDGLDDLTADQLKGKLAELQAAGVEVDTSGVKKKADLVARIRAALSSAE